jgi:hypothetical protein
VSSSSAPATTATAFVLDTAQAGAAQEGNVVYYAQQPTRVLFAHESPPPSPQPRATAAAYASAYSSAFPSSSANLETFSPASSSERQPPPLPCAPALLPPQQQQGEDAEPPPDVDVDAPAEIVTPQPESPPLALTGVFCAFLESAVSRKPATGMRALIKRAIAVRSGGTRNHVELVFLFDDYTALACSVIREEGVLFKKRNFNCRYLHPYWQTFELDVTPEQRLALYAFCVAQNGKPFNHRGLYFNFAPLCLPACCGAADPPDQFYIYNPSWFCSQLCTAALQYADRARFGGVSPAETHVEALYQLLRDRKARNTRYVTTMYKPSSVPLEI